MNKIELFEKFISLILIGVSFTACQASEKNKWTPPKFVKEWEIKEIKPGLPHHIISMTANMNGVFVLVKMEERLYLPPKTTSEMTNEELKNEESFFGKILSDAERKSKNKVTIIERDYYFIQHFDFHGSLLRQWPQANILYVSNEIKMRVGQIVVRTKTRKDEIDSRDELIKPLAIASDDEGNIFLADYEGNKIVKFGSDGTVLNLWRITKRDALAGYYDSLGFQRGLAVSRDRLYIVSEGFNPKAGPVPMISEYDLDGRLLREKNIKNPEVPTRIAFFGEKIPLLKDKGNIAGIATDRDGNLFLYSPDSLIVQLDSQWNDVKHIKTVLDNGFESPKPVYDPERKKEVRYEEDLFKVIGGSLRGFSSDKASWMENGPGLYYANNIALSQIGQIYISFVGTKPFGVIDAMIFNKTGKMLGYWKHDKKSYSEWFDKLTDWEKLETTDTELNIVIHGKYLFIGRTLLEGKTIGKHHSIIQMFSQGGD